MKETYHSDDGTSFHIQLLSKIIDMNQYPFIKLIIEKNITREEFNSLMRMLDHLNKTYVLQKEEGLLDYSRLLIQFAGMLNEKLDPTKTIQALSQEGHFPLLMREFIRILEEDDKRYSRKGQK